MKQKELECVQEQVWYILSQVRGQVSYQVSCQARDRIWHPVQEQIRARVQDQVRARIWRPTLDQIWAELKGVLR